MPVSTFKLTRPPAYARASSEAGYRGNAAPGDHFLPLCGQRGTKQQNVASQTLQRARSPRYSPLRTVRPLRSASPQPHGSRVRMRIGFDHGDDSGGRADSLPEPRPGCDESPKDQSRPRCVHRHSSTIPPLLLLPRGHATQPFPVRAPCRFRRAGLGKGTDGTGSCLSGIAGFRPGDKTRSRHAHGFLHCAMDRRAADSLNSMRFDLLKKFALPASLVALAGVFCMRRLLGGVCFFARADRRSPGDGVL